jgi:hypothetical protein
MLGLVIQRTLNPRLLSKTGGERYPLGLVIQRTLNPRPLSQTAPCDVTSNIHQALAGGDMGYYMRAGTG